MLLPMENKIIKMFSVAGVMLASSYVFGEGGYFTYTHEQKVRDEKGKPTGRYQRVTEKLHSELLEQLENKPVPEISLEESVVGGLSPKVAIECNEMDAIIAAAKKRKKDLQLCIKGLKAGDYGMGKPSSILKTIQTRQNPYTLSLGSARREVDELNAIIDAAQYRKDLLNSSWE